MSFGGTPLPKEPPPKIADHFGRRLVPNLSENSRAYGPEDKRNRAQRRKDERFDRLRPRETPKKQSAMERAVRAVMAKLKLTSSKKK